MHCVSFYVCGRRVTDAHRVMNRLEPDAHRAQSYRRCTTPLSITVNVFAVEIGDRIAQLILERIVTPEVIEVDDIEETERGAGGFGSTGVKAAE